MYGLVDHLDINLNLLLEFFEDPVAAKDYIIPRFFMDLAQGDIAIAFNVQFHFNIRKFLTGLYHEHCSALVQFHGSKVGSPA